MRKRRCILLFTLLGQCGTMYGNVKEDLCCDLCRQQKAAEWRML